MTVFFYFSGFDALADELEDKKIRILVGKTIDPEAINELSQQISYGVNVDLSEYAKRGFNSCNNTQKKDELF